MTSFRTVKKGALSEALSWLLPVALFIAFHSNIIISTTKTFTHDSLIWFGIPYTFYDGLFRFQPPLWNPYPNGGQPFFYLWGMHNLYDIPSLIGFAIGAITGSDILDMFQRIYMFRIVLAALGVGVLVREITSSRMCSCFALTTSLFSSFALASLRQNGLLYSFMLTPWILFVALRFFKTSSRVYLVLLALLVGMNFSNYTVAYSLLYFAIILVYFAIYAPIKFFDFVKKLRIIDFILFIAISIAMASPFLSLYIEKENIVPIVRTMANEEVKMNFEGDFESVSHSKYSTKGTLRDYIGLIAPSYAFASHFNENIGSESFLYVGVAAIFLALVAVAFDKSPLTRCSLFSAICISLIFLGTATPAYRLVHAVFLPIRFARHMHLLGSFITFTIIVLASIGLKYLISAHHVYREEGAHTGTASFILTTCAITLVSMSNFIELFSQNRTYANASLIILFATFIYSHKIFHKDNPTPKWLPPTLFFIQIISLLLYTNVSGHYFIQDKGASHFPLEAKQISLPFSKHKILIDSNIISKFRSNLTKQHVAYEEYSLPIEYEITPLTAHLFAAATLEPKRTHYLGIPWDTQNTAQFFNTLLNRMSSPQPSLPRNWFFDEQGTGAQVRRAPLNSSTALRGVILSPSSHGHSLLRLLIPNTWGPLAGNRISAVIQVRAEPSSSNGVAELRLCDGKGSASRRISLSGGQTERLSVDLAVTSDSRWLAVYLIVPEESRTPVIFSKLTVYSPTHHSDSGGQRIESPVIYNDDFSNFSTAMNPECKELLRVILEASRQYIQTMPPESRLLSSLNKATSLLDAPFSNRFAADIKKHAHRLFSNTLPIRFGVPKGVSPAQPVKRLSDIYTTLSFHDFATILYPSISPYNTPLYVLTSYNDYMKVKSDMSTLNVALGVFPHSIFRFFPGDGSGHVPSADSPEELPASAVQLLEYSYNKAVFKIDTPQEGVFYFADNYDNNWKAEVNGKQSTILTSYGPGKAVHVSRGSTLIKMYYSPSLFIAGIVINQVCLLLCTVYLSISCFRKHGPCEVHVSCHEKV